MKKEQIFNSSSRIVLALCGALLISLPACKTMVTKKLEGQRPVSSLQALYAAIASARPGEQILLADGVYRDVQLVVSNSGTADKPIRIAAQNPGKAFFTGDAKVELSGEYLVLEGIFFKDGKRDPDRWRSHGPGLVAIYGSHNRVTGCAFDAFDDANSAWVTTSIPAGGKVPQYCRIDHCSFVNKLTFDQVINLNNTPKQSADSTKAGPPMYHRVDHNFFSNPPKPGNAGGGIRIGYYRYDTGRCVVDSNLFMRQDSEAEIITSKSMENIYYANTFLNCQGTLNFRHGDHQVAVSNFFVGTDTSFGYGGMFVWGSRHLIAANYFNLPRTIKSRGNAALYLNPGAPGTEHALAFDIEVINNIFVNRGGYAVHFNPLDKLRKDLSSKNGWIFRTPYNIRFYNNLFFTVAGSLYPVFRDDYSGGRDQIWEDNIASKAELGIAATMGIVTEACDLKKEEGVYWPVQCPSFRFRKVNNITPIRGVPLDLIYLVSHGITGSPLTPGDVGPGWTWTLPDYAHHGKLSAELGKRQQQIIERTNK